MNGNDDKQETAKPVDLRNDYGGDAVRTPIQRPKESVNEDDHGSDEDE